MKRTHILGLLVGGCFGAGISDAGILSLILGFPGTYVAFMTGALESGTQVGNSWFAVAAPINAAVYGLIGLAAATVHEARKERQNERSLARRVPECAICGFVWVTPTKSSCPKCGAKKAFVGWVGRVQVPLPCSDCGYDLTGNESGVCPECGTKIESS